MTSSAQPDSRLAPPMAPRQVIGPTNPVRVADALRELAAPSLRSCSIQVLRPPTLFTKNAYSTMSVLPIGPAYIAAMLEAAGYQVSVIDAIGEAIGQLAPTACGRFVRHGMDDEAIVARIAPETKILCASLMFSQNWPVDRRLLERVRAARPDLTIIVGGEHVTALPELVLRTCAAVDYAVTGEGELSVLLLAHRIATGREIEPGLPGIWRRDAQGGVTGGGLGLRIADFEALPRPAWHLYPVETYRRASGAAAVSYGLNMPILATRGCPFQCTFCSSPSMWTVRYVTRPPGDVADEMQRLIDTYAADAFDFADLTAIVKKEWTLDFCTELRRRDVKTVWQLPSGTRSEALDGETLQAIYDAGCRFLPYAPESGSAKTLRQIKKKVNLDNLVASIRESVRIGHTTKANFVIGFPDDTRASILQTYRLILRLALIGIADCNTNIFIPYPGSELFARLVEEGKLGTLDDEYFFRLANYKDFTRSASFCERIGSRELGVYRVLLMGSFYALSYLTHPRRLLRLLGNVVTKRYRAHSIFEQRVFDYLDRRRKLASQA